MKRVYRATSCPGFETIEDRVIKVEDEIIVSQEGDEIKADERKLKSKKLN